MITKRNKGVRLHDPVMPVRSNDRTAQQLSNEMTETNTDNRKIKDDLINHDISKIATSLRPKVETLRANSPTFKRLVAVRIKLDKYLTSIPITISPSQQLIPEIANHETQSTIDVRVLSSSEKRVQSKTKPSTAPLDKITYEKTLTNNGNVKQKCSLEIWLPKAGLDDDEGNTSQASSPSPYTIRKKSPPPQPIFIKTRRLSAPKLPATTTITNNATKSLDEISSKKSEPIIVPRVYHYEEYLTDQSEERPRSGKSGNTNKSDGNGSSKNGKRQRTRSNARHLSLSTNNIDETVQSPTSGLPMSSKHLLANLKQTHTAHETKGTPVPTSSSVVNELMKKYSTIKKSHQELTQPKLQLEKPYQDSKSNPHTTKDRSLASPLGSDSTIHTSSDRAIVSGRKFLGDTSSPQLAGDYPNTKTTDRHSLSRKPTYVDIYPQARLFSLVNHLQHRQVSGSMPAAILPAVVGKKTEDLHSSFQRSKTLDVVFAFPLGTTNQIPSRSPAQFDSPQNLPHSSNLLQRPRNGNEPISPHISKRPLPPPSHARRSEQQQQQPKTSQPLVQLVQYQNIQSSAQRYHHPTHFPSTTAAATTDVSSTKALVHLKYSNGGNIDRNCLIPE